RVGKRLLRYTTGANLRAGVCTGNRGHEQSQLVVDGRLDEEPNGRRQLLGEGGNPPPRYRRRTSHLHFGGIDECRARVGSVESADARRVWSGVVAEKDAQAPPLAVGTASALSHHELLHARERHDKSSECPRLSRTAI